MIGARHSQCPPIPDDVSTRPWDVLVVGAGPAGSLAARSLAHKGLAVLLVDKAAFPRSKVCGCCLNSSALATLERAGLGALTAALKAQPLKLIDLAAGSARALIPLRGGVSLSRGALDMALARAAIDAGVTFLHATLAAKDWAGDPCDVVLHCGGAARTVRPRAIIVADGIAGTFLSGAAALGPTVRPGSRLGAGAVIDAPLAPVRPGVISMTCGAGGYVGMVRLEDGQLNIAAALDHECIRSAGGPGRASAAILARAGRDPVAGLVEARWHGTPPLTRRRRVYASNIFVVGDAAGYVEPFTGEGMAWALASAEAVAPLVAAYLDGTAMPAAWSRRHRRLVGGRQHVCGVVAWALRRPRLAGAAIGVLAAAPVLAAPLARLVDRTWSHEGATA